MLQFIIKFLQNIDENENIKKVFWYFLMFFKIIFFTWLFTLIIINNFIYNSYIFSTDYYSLFSILSYVLIWFLFLLLFLYRKENIIFLYLMPVLFFILWFLNIEKLENIKIFFIFLIAFPFLSIFERFLSKIKIYIFLYKFFFYYNFIFFSLLSLFWLFLIFTESIENIILIYFIYLIFIYFLIWFHIEKNREIINNYNFNIKIIYILIYVNIIIWFYNNFLGNYILEKANNILTEYWETKEWFEKLWNMWFLKDILKNLFDKWKLDNDYKILFKKIYDTTIESTIDKEVDIEKYSSNFSNETSRLSVNKNAQVNLKYAEYKNEYLKDINVIKNTITYEFQNKWTTNQEVVFEIELPNSDSIITDLKLWLNLQHQWLIAPRWAAEQVYKDSMRVNRDPAIIEQLWPKVYKLKVFPVLWVDDNLTNWRQKIQFTYLSHIDKDSQVILTPKVSFINLKIDKETNIVIKLLEKEKLLFSDSLKENKETSFWKNYIFNWKIDKNTKNICWITNISNEKKINKNIVFFDISKSVWNEKWILKKYEEILELWKKQNVDLDIYTYNFKVYPNDYNIWDLSFWWYTDTSSIIDYISENNIENANIVIVSDDDSFEYTNRENKDIKYNKLSTNIISFIQIWDKIRTIKNELTKSIFASNGEYYNYENEKNKIEKLYNIKKDDCITENTNYANIVNIFKLYHEWNSTFSNLTNENDLMNFTTIQEKIYDFASKWNFVNQYASFIAVETQQQLNDLNQYSQLEDKFDSEYNNHEIDNNPFGTTSEFKTIIMEMEEVDPISTFWMDSNTDSIFSINKYREGTLENQNWWENSKNILLFIITIFIIIVFFIIRLIKRKK